MQVQTRGNTGSRGMADEALSSAIDALTISDAPEPTTPAARDAEKSDGTPTTPKTKKVSSSGGSASGKKTPSALLPPFITQPAPGEHAATLVMLPGFTNTGKAYGNGWLPTRRQKLGGKRFGRIKFVWLNAPVRAVSCYGEEWPRLPAWHDYFTDHGGAEGRPDIEETVDVGQLEWSAAQVCTRGDDRSHAAIWITRGHG